MKLLSENPEFMRYFRKSMRKGKASTSSTVFLVACGLCLAVNLFFFYRIPFYRSFQTCFQSIFFQIIGFNFLQLLGFGAHGCSDSVSSERQSNTLDFQRITGMNPYTVAFGKILGVPFVQYRLAAVAMPVTMMCVVCGGVSMATYGLAYLLLVVFSLSYCSLSTLVSALRKEKTAQRTSPIVLILVLAWIGPTIIFGVTRTGGPGLGSGIWTCLFPIHSLLELAQTNGGGYRVLFFGTPVSGIVLTCCVNAFLFLAFWAGAARRIENDSQSLWSKTQLLCCSMVVFGLMGSYLWSAVAIHSNPLIPISICTILAHAWCAFVAAVAAPGHYAFRLGVRQRKSGHPRGIAILDEKSLALPFVITLVLVFAAVILTVAITREAAMARFLDPLSLLFLLFSVLICCVAYSTMAQLCKLAAPVHGMKLYGGVVFVWAVIPFAAGELLKFWNGSEEINEAARFILYLSPLGPSVNSFQNEGMQDVRVAALGAFCLLAVLTGWLWTFVSRRCSRLERQFSEEVTGSTN